MGTLERFNLRWDGFEENTKAAFRQFKEEKEFFDVTLVGSDGKQVEANKVVLAGGSSFFHKILKENPHPHPLIYLKGVSYQYLLSVLDFLYTGEANILQSDLNGFLAIAEDLKVKGLTPKALPSSPADKPSLSPEVSHPHSAASATPASLHGQVASEECVLSPKISYPHIATSASLHGQLEAELLVLEMGTLERFNLRWDGFEVNTKAAFRQFKEEREFFDVTLVGSDGKQVEANKVVLAGGSSFFHKILKENPHPHPLIYLKGVSYQYLLSVLDFLYTGEANILQSDLNGFLGIAEDLKVKGLTSNSLPSSPADKASLSPEVSHPHSAASATPASLHGQVSADECVLSPKISHPHIAISTSLHGQVEADECLLSPNISHPHIAISTSREGHVATEEPDISPSAVSATPATLRGQSAAEDTIPTPAIVHHHNAKPASYQSQVAFEESTTTFRVPNVASSDLSNTVVQATSIEEDNDDTFKVKVEFEECDAAYYNVSCGIDDHGEHYIKHVSTGGLEDNQENIGSKNNISVAKVSGDNTINRQKFQNASEHDYEGIGQCSEKEVKPKKKMIKSSCNVAMTPRGPEDDNMLDSNCNMVVTEAADSGFINEQSEDDSGDRIEENRDDVMPEGELDFNEETCCCCTKTFSKSSELKKHKMMRIGEKQFVCLVCYKVYCALGKLTVHKNIHEDEKKFQCSVCFRRFSKRGILNKHKRFHTGENVFKKFKKRSNLNKRKMSHATEKLFQCLVCFKKFSRKDTLHLHERYHTTEKPQCLQCSKKFSRLSSLNRHKKLHVGKKS